MTRDLCGSLVMLQSCYRRAGRRLERRWGRAPAPTGSFAAGRCNPHRKRQRVARSSGGRRPGGRPPPGVRPQEKENAADARSRQHRDDAFAPSRRGTYPDPRHELTPSLTWTLLTPHHTRLPRRVGRRQSWRAATPRRGLGRRGKLTLAGALAVLALLVAAGPAGAWTSRERLPHRRPRLGPRHRHVAVGRLRLRQARLDLQGHPQALLHRHRRSATPRTIDIRVRLRSGLSAVKVSCPKAYTATGSGQPARDPRRRDRDHDLRRRLVPRGRRQRAQGLQLPGHVRAELGVAARPHGDRPRRHGPVSRRDPRRAQRRLADDDQQRPARELPARLRAARGVALVAGGGAQGRRPARRAPSRSVRASRASPGTCTATCAARPTWASASKTRAPTPPSARPPESCPIYDGKPILAVYFSCSGGHTENIEDGWPGAAPIPYLKGVDDPYDYYGSLHDWGPLRRTAAQLGGPLGRQGLAARRLHRSSAARRRAS